MERNRIINDALVSLTKVYSMSISELLRKIDPEVSRIPQEESSIIEFMVGNNLIEKNSTIPGYHHKISFHGRQIVELGGWIKYLEDIATETRNEESIKSDQRQKLVFETKLLKWQTKTFWPLFFFAIIGGICGIISLSIQLFYK